MVNDQKEVLQALKKSEKHVITKGYYVVDADIEKFF